MAQKRTRQPAEMKRLIFGDGLMPPTLDGSKCFTVRKYRQGSHDFSKDEIIIGEFKDGLNILLRVLKDTKKGAFKGLIRSKAETGKNGYWFDESYFEDLKAYYPDLTWDTTGAIIIFEVLKVNGTPVVSLNEHAR